MRVPNCAVPVNCVVQFTVKGFKGFTFLAEQKAVDAAFQSTDYNAFSGIILTNRSHVKIIAEENAFESHALSEPCIIDDAR